MDALQLQHTRELSRTDKQELIALWNSEYPQQLAYKDFQTFESYLLGLLNTDHYLLRNTDQAIMGWAFTFTRDGSRWFAIILHRVAQGSGQGSRLIKTLQDKESSLHGWVADHERYTKQDQRPYPSPLSFYLKNGFSVCPDKRLESEQLSAVQITWQKP